MSELWKKIYDQVITYERDWIEMSRCVEQKTSEILRDYSEKMDEENFGRLRDDFVDATAFAERESFYLGMKHAFRMFAEMTGK